jgi:hypothetical protein
MAILETDTTKYLLIFINPVKWFEETNKMQNIKWFVPANLIPYSGWRSRVASIVLVR